MQIGQGESLVQFLCPALPNRPRPTVLVVSSGQDGLSQTLYLQKWLKSAFEIVVRVSSNEGASGKTAPKWSAPQTPSIGRMVDREAKRTEGKGIGYDRWASMHNLKAWSKTFMYLQEHDLLSADKLSTAVDAAGAEAREARSRYDAAAAKRQLDKLGAPKQFPKRKDVIAEIQSLISEKNECYNDYREKSDRLHELMNMQRNYQMAMQPQQPKHGRKHETEL